MQVQNIFIRASEEYEENGFFDLNEQEFSFLKERFEFLNQNNNLTFRQGLEVKGIIAILLYADKEDYIRSMHLSEKVANFFEEVYNEFC